MRKVLLKGDFKREKRENQRSPKKKKYILNIKILNIKIIFKITN
jgi:hypothetical protein